MLASHIRRFHFLAALLILLAPLKAVAENVMIGGVPVPAEVRPGAGESPFFGAWFGAWGARWRTVLIVETVEDDRIVATYAVGPNGSFKGGNRRLEGRIDGERATLEGPSYVIDIALTPHGTMRARYNGDQGFAVLNRGDLAGDHPWIGGAAEMIETDLTEDGAALRLKTLVFKPSEGASFPLALINHGSSAYSGDRDVFDEVWVDPWIADLLVERGWLVAFPQRRGRGGSDGLYDEGFKADRSAYSCDGAVTQKGAERALEDIEAAIAALRLRPDVTIGPVLIGGMSRGGALSVAWAGRNPQRAHGVVNFVGGWLSEGCGDAEEVNKTLFAEGGPFPRDTLWLYGADDPFYSLPYSRKNFAAFINAGGRGAFHEFALNGENNGHWVQSVPTLWQDQLIGYLDALD